MLLLVLVFVLIAFGLLVVALLSGSALWAWVSVAVSVVAALVLLVDWLQRRSAMHTADRQQAGLAAPPGWTSVDADPVTEQIPVVHRGGAAPPESVMAADTVVVRPTRQPPVSPQQPSSAPPWAPPAGDSRSREVVGSGVGSPAESPPPPVQRADIDPVAGAGRVNGVTQSGPPVDAPPSQTVPVQHDDFDVDVEKTADVKPTAADKAAEVKPAADKAAEVKPAAADEAAAVPGEGPTDTSDDAGDTSLQSGSEDAKGTDAAAAKTADAAATATTEQPPDDTQAADKAKNEDGPTGAVSAPGPAVAAAATGPAGSATAARAATAAAEKASIFEKPDTSNEQTMIIPVAAADTEPPEEPHDAGNAAVVAALTDVVVVIDERPRYHVSGCRFLRGKAEIPLPVKEAVELGFTPCGWCNPDRTLSNKHRATSSR